MQAPELLLRARLRNRVEALFGVDGAEVLVGLTGLLDLRPDRERVDRLPRLSPEAMERVGAAAVHALLVRLAADGPLVIAVEDVHWADAGSLRLLETVLECTQFSGIAVVITQRPEREHPSWQLRELAQRRLAHRTTEIMLGPLPAGADADLLTALAGTDPVDPGLGRRLLATAEGNPFFLEELVRSLPDRSRRPDGAMSVDIPATVEQVLGSRIGRLPATAQQSLVTAAVLGRRFSHDTLVEVAGLDAVPTEALRELAAHGLVAQTQGWPTAEFEFRHVLTHEAAYRSLWPPRRRELHRRSAEVLQAKVSTHPGARDEALAATGSWQATTSRRWRAIGAPPALRSRCMRSRRSGRSAAAPSADHAGLLM
jgi:predicted ATPase